MLSLCMQVVEQAHAVVLASGTLSPVASLTRQLFPTLDPSAITHFTCGHVVPKEQLLALAVAQACSLTAHLPDPSTANLPSCFPLSNTPHTAPSC